MPRPTIAITSDWSQTPNVATRQVVPLDLDLPAQIAILLGLAKVAFAGIAFYLAKADLVNMIAVLVGIAMIVDIADGIVFKFSRLAEVRQLANLRRVFDTLTDRVLIGSTLWCLYVFAGLPLEVLLVAACREALLAFVVCRPYLGTGLVLKPNLASRIGSILLGAQAMIVAVGSTVPLYLLVLFVGFSLVGIFQYIAQSKTGS